MKIFSASQILQWDKKSIEEESIGSEVLMERAANACCEWLLRNEITENIWIFCGKGNNGGDGLALARLLIERQIPAEVFILETGREGSRDFQLNLLKLHTLTTAIHFIQDGAPLPDIGRQRVLIDALFGTGLNKPLSGIAQKVVQHLNESGNTIISIDMPSGLYCDKSSLGDTVIKASVTLAFTNKLAFLMAENEIYSGQIAMLNIGLSRTFESSEYSSMEMVDHDLVQGIYRPRKSFSHKGNHGNTALICGSHGMMGAAILTARGCLAAGTGKVYCYVEPKEMLAMQVSVPEAICIDQGDHNIDLNNHPSAFRACAIGPGLGEDLRATELLRRSLAFANGRLVVDASALNCLAAQPELLDSIPQESVITPHPAEFDRLFGKSVNDFARLETAITKSKQYNIYIVLKGHHTAIITPRGRVYFNTTGNAGMAKGGTGDVLTGILGALCAQRYPLPEAAILGVYLHGLAGDIAAKERSQEAMTASHLIGSLGEAWKLISGE